MNRLMERPACRGLIVQMGMMVLLGAGADAARADSSTSHSEGNAGAVAPVASGESASARSGDIGGAGLRLGTIVGGITGAALDGWWQANPDLQVGLFFGSGSVDHKSEVNADADSAFVRATKADVTGSLLLVGARYFVGNSFFVGGGLGQRKVGIDLRVEDELSDEFVNSEFEVTSVVAHFTLGNLWTWDGGFYLGADWFALSYPLSSSNEVSTEVSSSLNDDLRELQEVGEDGAEDIGETPSYQLALFHIGYAF